MFFICQEIDVYSFVLRFRTAVSMAEEQTRKRGEEKKRKLESEQENKGSKSSLSDEVGESLEICLRQK